MNPDGGEYDIATGSYRIVAQEPPAELRLDRCRHRPEPQLGLQVGLLRRLVRQHQLGDLPGAAPFSAPETRCCATS